MGLHVQGLKARVVVVLVGSNDLGQNGPGTAEETTKGIRAIVDYVREVIPEAQVVPMAILPRGRITHHGQVYMRQPSRKAFSCP